MKTGVKVSDAMTVKPITVTSKTPIGECSKLMADKHVGALVAKDKTKVVGIITEQDIVRNTIAKGKNPLELQMKHVMNPNIISISPEKDLFEALKVMRDENIRHLPVVHDNEMVGLLTLKDVLKIQPTLFELLVEKFELREEERKPIFNIGEKEGICQECGKYSKKLFNKDNVLVCGYCK